MEKTRALVQFIKNLSGTATIEDLLFLLRSEIKQYDYVKDPILAFVNSHTDYTLLYFQGAQVVEKVVSGVWPQQLRIRLNDVKDSQYLADVFGRPFARLLTIPLNLKRKSSENPLQVSAVLYFEHDLKKHETPGFLDFIEERLQPISIALDRLLLGQDLNEAALMWERTFDGLLDPVVIFDSQGQILRANKSYTDNLKELSQEQLMSSVIRHKDKIYEMHSYPIVLGDEGRSTNLIHHYVDVTIAHKLQNQMIQNEKMAALGQMAGHIAHELNNPLTGIRSLAQILIQQTSNEGNLKQDLCEVERAAERCQTIIKNLLEFSSGGIANHQVPVAMNDIVSRTLPLLKTLLSRFSANIELTEESNFVLVEPHLMQQVVFNIVKNAAQAMGESGTLTIRTYVEPGMTMRDSVVNLSIHDTGPGIAPEIQGKIFDFFFTTKTSSQGTGIGLSMSQSIVDRFGGTIHLKSEMGKGSEFRVQLPLYKL